MDTPLRKIRKQQRLTLEALSDAVGLGVSALSRIERGERGVSKKSLEALVSCFGGALQEVHILYPERYPNFLEEPKKVA